MCALTYANTHSQPLSDTASRVLQYYRELRTSGRGENLSFYDMDFARTLPDLKFDPRFKTNVSFETRCVYVTLRFAFMGAHSHKSTHVHTHLHARTHAHSLTHACTYSNIQHSGVKIGNQVFFPTEEAKDAIAFSARLDSEGVFKRNWQADTSIRWQYFGSVSGFFRVSPVLVV